MTCAGCGCEAIGLDDAHEATCGDCAPVASYPHESLFDEIEEYEEDGE